MYPSTTAERLGVAAGIVVTALVVGTLFVGPWRQLAVEQSGTIPVSSTDNPGGLLWLLPPLGSALAGAIAGGTYPQLQAFGEEDASMNITKGILAVPMTLIFAVTVWLFVVPRATTILDGSVVAAVVGALLGLVFAVWVWTVAATTWLAYVGVPTVIGVFAGAKLSNEVLPNDDGEYFETESDDPPWRR